MKKFICSLLTLSFISLSGLILCACGKPASSPIEDFTYEFEDNKVTITGYTGSDLEIVVPDTIEERPVTVIGEKAFQEYDMTSIIIPNTITLIEEHAFEDCKQLKKIDIPDSVTEISSHAFCGCENLEEVNLGSELKTIGQNAFVSCNSLKSIRIPEYVTYMYDIGFGYSDGKFNDFTIYGKSGSDAERYSKEYDNITFIAE